MSQAAQEHPSPDGLVGVLAKITPRASGGDTLEVPAQISTFLLQEDYLSRVAEVEFGEIELMKARWQQRSIAVTEQDDNPRGWVRAEIQYAYPGLSPEERVKIETLVWLVRNACPDKFTSSADQFQPLNMRRLSTTPVRGLVRMVIDRLEQFAKGGNVQQIVPVDRLEAEIVSLREKLAASEARREAAETGELEAEEEVRQAQALASELRRQMEEVIQAYQTLREQTKPGTMTGEDIARAIEEAQQRGIKTGEGKAEIQIYQLRTQIRELKAENARLAEEGAAAQGEVTKANRRLALEQQEAAVVAAELKFLKQRVAASDFVPKAEVDRLVQIALDGLRQQHLQQIAQLEEQLAEAGKRAAEAEAKAAKAEAALQESAQQRVSTKDAKVRPIGPERVDVEADMGQKKAAEASAWIAKHRKTLQILDQIRDYHGEWFYPDLIRADISSLQDVPSEVTNYLVLSLAWAQRQLNIEDNREMGELDPRILSDGDRVSIAQAAAETNNRPLPTIDSVDVACQGEIISSPKSDADAALEASMRELVSLAEVVATRPLPASIGDVRGINIVIRKNKIGIAQLMQALGITPTGDPQRFTKMVCMGTWPRVGPVAVAFNPDYSPKKAESPAQYLLDVAEVLARVLETGQPIVPLLSYGLAFNKQQFIDGLYTVEGQIGTPESSYSFLREFDSHSLSSE
ncbi:hypothetical protein FJY90_06845, partial [Candidatus Gottesmanbacteria bacterium]|nr:hypothetical protein [Candidatus Gottesmanbacteria bacterium]